MAMRSGFLTFIISVIFAFRLFALEGLSIGLNVGFEADTFKYGQMYGKIAYFNGMISGSRYFFNDLDSVAVVDRLYIDLDDVTFQLSNIPSTRGIAIFENFSQPIVNEVGPDKFLKPKSTALGLISIIFGGNAKYSTKYFTFRIGVTYDFFVNTENSFIWNDNYYQYPLISTRGNVGITPQQTMDLVLMKARLAGVATLPSTGGRDVTIMAKFIAMRLEVPVSIAFNFINIIYLKGYIGGGLTVFKGRVTRILDDSLPNTMPDVDSFGGTTVGFHFLTGLEYLFIERLSVSIEIFSNFGKTPSIKDQVVSDNPYIINSFFHTLENGDDPGPEKTARSSILDFTGIRILIGANYYIL